MRLAQGKRLKQLEQRYARLKRLVRGQIPGTFGAARVPDAWNAYLHHALCKRRASSKVGAGEVGRCTLQPFENSKKSLMFYENTQLQSKTTRNSN